MNMGFELFCSECKTQTGVALALSGVDLTLITVVT